MGGIEWWQPVLVLIGTVVVAGGTYLGASKTAASAKAGTNRVADVDAQKSAIEAWQELLEPYRTEVVALRQELATERDARTDFQREVEAMRVEREKLVQSAMDKLNERVDLLTIELNHWKRLAKVIARWATTLRDQVLQLGGQVPVTPNELLLIQTIDEVEDDPDIPRGKHTEIPKV